MLWRRLSTPWQLCLTEAWQAYCAGSLPIGAVIVDAEETVVARGRNRLFEPAGTAGVLSGCRMAHAEMNALLALRDTETQTDHYTLYTTLEPCPMCLGAIRMYWMNVVHIAARDPVAGSTALATATDFMRQGQTNMVAPADEILEGVILSMLTERIMRLQVERWVEATEGHDVLCAAAVAVGRRHYASGELARWGADARPVARVVDQLAQQWQTHLA